MEEEEDFFEDDELDQPEGIPVRRGDDEYEIAFDESELDQPEQVTQQQEDDEEVTEFVYEQGDSYEEPEEDGFSLLGCNGEISDDVQTILNERKASPFIPIITFLADKAATIVVALLIIVVIVIGWRVFSAMLSFDGDVGGIDRVIETFRK